MLDLFRQGFDNSGRNMPFVCFLFLIDIVLIALTGILSLEWITNTAGARIIVLHYDIFKAVKAAPDILKIAVEVFVMSGSIAAAGQFINSGHIKRGAFLKDGLKNYLRMCLLTFIWFATAVLPAFVWILIYIAYLSGAHPVFSALFIGGGISFLLIMTAIFFMSPFILVLDGKSALQAIKESFDIAKKSPGRLMLFIGIYFLISFILYLTAALAIGAYISVVEFVTHSTRVGQFARFSIEALFSFAARYVYLAGIFASALFYYKAKNGRKNI